MRFDEYLEQIQLLKNQNKSFVSVTLVHCLGSAPQELGARCIVTEKGLVWGTVGGGKSENHVIQQAKTLLTQEGNLKTHFEKINLQKDLGMSCGGEVSFFYEIFKLDSLWNVAIFGAGHVAQELIPLLMKLDVKITCVDSRLEWLEKLPNSNKLIKIKKDKMEEAVQELADNNFICIMTMGHATDLPIIKESLKRNFPYVGSIGSETKAKKVRSDLALAGFSQEKIKQLYCPIGEAIGRDTPEEISFSVIAQLLKVRG